MTVPGLCTTESVADGNASVTFSDVAELSAWRDQKTKLLDLVQELVSSADLVEPLRLLEALDRARAVLKENGR